MLLHVTREGVSTAEASAVQGAVEDAMRRLGVAEGTEVSVVLTDDLQLRELNAAHRGMDEPTDVLSFATDRAFVPDAEPPYLGDIIISVDSASRGARQQHWELVDELRLLAVHGLLHLLGHDDETQEQATAMRSIEVELGVRPAAD